MWGENVKNCECGIVWSFPWEKFRPHVEVQ